MISNMPKIVGYMVTWTTYGTWLQGDERGYVKNGKKLPINPVLKKANVDSTKRNKVRLKKKQREIVKAAIMNESKRNEVKMLALAVFSNHVHIVLGYTGVAIEKTVGRLKNAARVALQKDGFIGKVWTRGFDKRYCFNEKSLKNRINYAQKHKEDI